MKTDQTTEWYQKALNHLKNKNFEQCFMKLHSRNSHRYLAFGVVFPEDVCKIHLTDATNGGELNGKTQEWNSIEEMLDAGWDVD